MITFILCLTLTVSTLALINLAFEIYQFVKQVRKENEL